jgi:hypothetical protein
MNAVCSCVKNENKNREKGRMIHKKIREILLEEKRIKEKMLDKREKMILKKTRNNKIVLH